MTPVRALTRCLALLAITALPWAATAQTAPPVRVGILMGLGDRLTLVHEEMQTGSLLDRNRRQVLPAAPQDFQADAVDAAVRALRQARPDATPVELPLGGDVATLPWRTEGERLVPEAGLADALARARVTTLIVVEPLAATAQLQTEHQTLGNGKLEGLGFYIDSITPMIRTDTRERGRGYLAPYAYFRTLVVDVSTLAIACQRRTTVSRVFSASRDDKSGNPWDALTPKRKVEILRLLVREELTASLQACLATAPR